MDINDLFKEDQFFKRFVDSNGNQLRINDYIRVDRIHRSKWINQALWKIGFSFKDGIYLYIAGLYIQEWLNSYPVTDKLESVTNQWIMDTKIREFDCYQDTKGTNNWRILGSDSYVSLINNPNIELIRVIPSWSLSHYILNQINKDLLRPHLDNSLSDEFIRDIMLQNLDKLNLIDFKI